MAQQSGNDENEHHYMENGRWYGKYKKLVTTDKHPVFLHADDSPRGAYLLPVDATERDRLDIMHTMLKTARDPSFRLLHAPTHSLSRHVGDMGERPRVLDLGCGTGIWLLEMAEEYPEATFLGVDINAMGPATLLANVDLAIPWDMETPWSLGEGSWDLVHLQMALGSVQNWRSLYGKIVRHLKPGTGWFESVEIDWLPRCDDGTLSSGMLTEWWDKYVSVAYESAHAPITYNPDTAREMSKAGFRDIQHKVYKLPLNGWPQSKVEHRTGMWYHIAMSPGHENSGGHGMEALSLAALTRNFGWSPEHAKRLCDEALQQAADPNVHAYNELHVYWARAPYSNER